MKSLSFLLVVCALFVAFSGAPAHAQLTSADIMDYWVSNYANLAIPLFSDFAELIFQSYYGVTLLAKAVPDECFFGVAPEGGPYFPPIPPPCPPSSVEKVNEAYVWGLAKAGDNIWFGSAPNVHCLVLGGYLMTTEPSLTDSWVCEFGRSWFANPPLDLPDTAGDWRPPNIYVYDTKTGTLTLKSNDLPAGAPTFDYERLRSTTGIRSAGTYGGVVILAGPSLSTQGGINLFAFDTKTGAFMGSRTLPQYNNIRKWLVAKKTLYTAVGNTLPPTGVGGGSVLKWINDKKHPDYPFAFEEVGRLDGAGAELAYHEKRLFVSTWPQLAQGATQLPAPAGLWMSPAVPKKKGLNNGHVLAWQKVWQSTDYEPDLATAISYGGGALHSFKGYLWWGTMHVPGTGAAVHEAIYGTPTTPDATICAFLGTYRPISIFRGKNFAHKKKAPTIELVYGLSDMPAYNGVAWSIVPNNMGAQPLYGASGFDNFFNNYTWTMAVYDKRLFVGTMDWSYLLAELAQGGDILGLPITPDNDLVAAAEDGAGADLWVFHSQKAAAQAASRHGAGNSANYGFRTMVADKKKGLFIGTANPMNLLTDLDDNKPEGGWELLLLKKQKKKKK